ncbi:NinE family protein [Cronobacter sakazakii]|uniref:NinE family protein n=1 Tax=Cronobacter sakazakii TaxID=28141 RepID=UPI000978B910|nr:NinE family protein [Cronobacter sakazakii]EGT4300188.1 NinE family protein [Cronobacter sakazakii]EGT4342555.1 NinE family protein [Cronobacter sakazakii]EGT4449038.1 NinE family protein [Cronobacter sakazakii]EGT4471768.1 NinE family protein [Cronobacter sakazakii]EJG0602328.1 NinE family protein [Cronobacter sakazakii]
MRLQRRSITDIVCENCKFMVRPRRKKKSELPPSQIPTYAYTAHLADVRWLRQRARRKHDS